MGGHGGLNILPQKRWNVYNFDNREKVRKDEEAAAREEQVKRDQSRKRDSHLRLERLRTARGLAPLTRSSPESENVKEEEEPSAEPVESEPVTGHINLFQGIKIFDVVQAPNQDEPAEEEDHRRKKMRKEAAAAARLAAREAEARTFTPEDDKYRLGYGVAGKGVKLPWYLERRNGRGGDDDEDGSRASAGDDRKRKSGKKSLQELREERLKREKREKERERALFMEQSRRDGGFSRRR